MYLVKSLEVLNLHPILIIIVDEVEDVAGPRLYTSIFRPEDEGVHGTLPKLRGIDRRCRLYGIGMAIKRYVNNGWAYDPDNRPHKKCCKYHEVSDDDGSSLGWHLHFQCHPNTRRR